MGCLAVAGGGWAVRASEGEGEGRAESMAAQGENERWAWRELEGGSWGVCLRVGDVRSGMPSSGWGREGRARERGSGCERKRA